MIELRTCFHVLELYFGPSQHTSTATGTNSRPDVTLSVDERDVLSGGLTLLSPASLLQGMTRILFICRKINRV
jgi:hypothetical protein